MSKTLSAAQRQLGYEQAKRRAKAARYNRRCVDCTATFTHKGRRCGHCEVARYLASIDNHDGEG